MRITSRASAFSGPTNGFTHSPTRFENKRASTRTRERASKKEMRSDLRDAQGEMRDWLGQGGARWGMLGSGRKGRGGRAEGAVDIRYISKRSQVLMTDSPEEVLCCPTVEGNEFQEAVSSPLSRHFHGAVTHHHHSSTQRCTRDGVARLGLWRVAAPSVYVYVCVKGDKSNSN